VTRQREAWRSYAAGSEVAHFAKFAREHLVQSEDRWEGKPFLLEPWQRRLFGEALAYGKDGWPVWGSVVIVAPRKNGKTTMLAAIALYRLLTDEGRPEILLAAPSDRVAGRLFDAAARFVRRSPELRRLLRVRDHAGEIVREDGLGILYRMSSDPARLFGFNPTHVVCDELAQWTTPSLRRAYAALTSGGGARSAPQVFTITTAGEASRRHDSILGRILDAGLDCDDLERLDALTVARMNAARTLVWAYEAPTNDPHDTDAMKQANPASWITKAYLRRQADDPELTDAQVLQLHGCVWAESETTWIAPDDWAARADRERQLRDGERIVLGFDGSYRRDATALVACAVEDGFVSPIAVWEQPDRAPKDWKVPRDEVDDELAEAMERFEVVELAVDPPGWHSEVEGWREAYGEVVVDFPTNSRQRMAAACDRFRVAVLEGDLRHDGSALLARHVGHCVTKPTPHGLIVTKEHPDSPRKIDAAVAAIVAYERVAWHRANVEPDTPILVALM
jgi:phage terminase large subunit-like protein